MTIFAYTDGASRGNPGESGIGVILKNEDGTTLSSLAGYIGKATNNIAEYKALIACIALTKKFHCTQLIVHSDSELLVRQLKKVYRIKDKTLRTLSAKVEKELSKAPFSFDIRHIDRALNREADYLANKGIETRKKIKV